jgi:hypothetical protein
MEYVKCFDAFHIAFTVQENGGINFIVPDFPT